SSSGRLIVALPICLTAFGPRSRTVRRTDFPSGPWCSRFGVRRLARLRRSARSGVSCPTIWGGGGGAFAAILNAITLGVSRPTPVDIPVGSRITGVASAPMIGHIALIGHGPLFSDNCYALKAFGREVLSARPSRDRGQPCGQSGQSACWGRRHRR